MENDSISLKMTYDDFMELQDMDSFDPASVPKGYGILYTALRIDTRRPCYFGITTVDRVPVRKNEHHHSPEEKNTHFDYVCRTHPDLLIWKIVGFVPLESLKFYEALFIRAYDTVTEYNSNYGVSISDHELEALKMLMPQGYFEQTSRKKKAKKAEPVLPAYDSGKPLYIRDKKTKIILKKVANAKEAANFLGKSYVTKALKSAIVENGDFGEYSICYTDVYDSINHVFRLNIETGEIEKIYDSQRQAAEDIFSSIKNKYNAKSPSSVREQIRRVINNPNDANFQSRYGYGWTDEAHIEAKKEAIYNKKLDNVVILIDSEGNEFRYSNIGTNIGAVAELLDIYNVPYNSEEELLENLADAIKKDKNEVFGFDIRFEPKPAKFKTV